MISRQSNMLNGGIMLDPRIYAYCEEDIVNISGFDRSELISAEEGRFVMHAHPGPDCGNNIGTVHGGFLLAFADTAGTGRSTRSGGKMPPCL